MNSHLTHTNSGLVTLYGLRKGYIQVSPNYCSGSRVYLTIEPESSKFVIKGINQKGNIINEKLKTKSIVAARAILALIK